MCAELHHPLHSTAGSHNIDVPTHGILAVPSLPSSGVRLKELFAWAGHGLAPVRGHQQALARHCSGIRRDFSAGSFSSRAICSDSRL